MAKQLTVKDVDAVVQTFGILKKRFGRLQLRLKLVNVRPTIF